ncbi:hypothetical protein ABVK25_011151 [Lepraria finkii]|uniref:Uncharacterized protein n=1 Tax=Lepraria finkii TaxID=1340010 RepID=A0ABR4AR77_9LECA
MPTCSMCTTASEITRLHNQREIAFAKQFSGFNIQSSPSFPNFKFSLPAALPVPASANIRSNLLAHHPSFMSAARAQPSLFSRNVSITDMRQKPAADWFPAPEHCANICADKVAVPRSILTLSSPLMLCSIRNAILATRSFSLEVDAPMLQYCSRRCLSRWYSAGAGAVMPCPAPFPLPKETFPPTPSWPSASCPPHPASQ